MASPMTSGLRSTVYHLKTLYLFTQSDFKTIVFPVMCTAIVLSQQCSPLRLFRAFSWTWLVLLQFCLSNQASTKSIMEDRVNKPWRPIPSSRISLEQARALRWCIVAICLGFSLHSHNLKAALVVIVSSWLHNDLGLSESWLSRNLLNAMGYMGFQYGAVIAASSANHKSVDNSALESILVFGFLIATTIQVQDFEDERGDRIAGRKTAVVVYPNLSRILTSLLIALWAVILPKIWSTPFLPSLPFTIFGIYISARIFVYRKQLSDKASYILYNLWLLLVFVLPGLSRLNTPGFESFAIPNNSSGSLSMFFKPESRVTFGLTRTVAPC